MIDGYHQTKLQNHKLWGFFKKHCIAQMVLMFEHISENEGNVYKKTFIMY